MKGSVLPTILLALAPLVAHASDADAVLALAEDAGRWIAQQSTEAGGERAWPDDAHAPDAVSLDLGTGVAGKIVFFVALYNATGDSTYLEEAMAGGEYLRRRLAPPDAFTGDRRASLYAGLSGALVAFRHLASVDPEARGDADLRYAVSRMRALAAVEAIERQLLDWAVVDGGEVYWSPTFNDLLFGDAGTVLALSAPSGLAGISGQSQARSGALRLAERLTMADDGGYWPFRRDRDFNLPNFSHGTAGVAFVLATAADQWNDEALVDAATAGADYLASIAVRRRGSTLMPYGWPADNWDGLYEFGWAHGLAGNLLALTKLEQSGIREVEAAALKRELLATLTSSGLPGKPVTPLAEPSTPHDLRFGRAGVLYVLAAIDPDGSAELCEALFGYLDEHAVRGDDTAHWPFDAPDFMGGGTQAPTGLLHGAAGIGLAVLEYHSALTGKAPYFEMPDLPRAR